MIYGIEKTKFCSNESSYGHGLGNGLPDLDKHFAKSQRNNIKRANGGGVKAMRRRVCRACQQGGQEDREAERLQEQRAYAIRLQFLFLMNVAGYVFQQATAANNSDELIALISDEVLCGTSAKDFVFNKVLTIRPIAALIEKSGLVPIAVRRTGLQSNVSDNAYQITSNTHTVCDLKSDINILENAIL